MKQRSITVTGDYAANVGGRWATTRSQLPAVLLALRSKKGSSAVAPSFGNRSGLVPDRITPSTPKTVQSDYRDAVQHLIDAGSIWDFTVECVASTVSSALEITVAFRDASGEQRERIV